jgi:hypothetical protein
MRSSFALDDPKRSFERQSAQVISANGTRLAAPSAAPRTPPKRSTGQMAMPIATWAA